PSTPPTITCLTAVSCTRVSVSWSPPPLANGPILSYVLYIREYPAGSTMIKDISDTSDGLHYMINGLKASTTYIVSLSTRNSMGEGPADVRYITTQPKKEISSSRHTPAYLVFAARQKVLKQGLRIFDEAEVLYDVKNKTAFVTGTALHVKQDLVFITDSYGNLHSITLKKPEKVDRIISSRASYPMKLSFDWLNGKLYMAEDKQITRCDIDGSNFEVVVGDMENRATDLQVDPLNGYLYWTMKDLFYGGGLYRVDLLEFNNGCVPFGKSQLIVNDNQLVAFAVDYKNFRLLLPSAANNTIVSVALDGSDVTDIRENVETALYTNVKSVAVHHDLLYWTSGSSIYGEEYHKKEDKFYQNVFSVRNGPFSSLNIYHSDCQPHPVPLNPVEAVEALFGSDTAKIRWASPRLLGGQGKGSWQKWLYEIELLDRRSTLTVFGVSISSNAYDVSNLKPNTTYSVKVRAYSDGGKGPWSSEFTGTTLKKSRKAGEPFILWGAREGLLKSEVLGENVQVLIHKINLNNAHIIDICWYDKMLFINTNTTFVYVYNTSVHNSLTRMQNISMAAGIAIDWFAPKLYWSTPVQQMISRSNLDGSQPEPLPILTMAKEIAIDSVNGYLYWATSHSVERSHLNGADHFIYMKNALFSGAHVMGLTLDFERKNVYWMVRSYEGSVMYRSHLAGQNAELRSLEKPEVVGLLSENGIHGSMWYFSNRLFWLHEKLKAFVSDINGKNFAGVEGLGLNGLTSLEIIDSSLQPHPEGYDEDTVKVVPHSVYEDEINIEGTSDSFNITWSPVLSVNYGTVFYEISVDDGDETYNLVTSDTVFVYPTMKYLSPYTLLKITIKAYTYWASSRQTSVFLHSPMSVPSKPLHPRIFITHKSSPVHEDEDIIADFRWSRPEMANGLIVNYRVICWLNISSLNVTLCDDIVNGNTLQFQSHSLIPNTTYYFQVRAITDAGEGMPSDTVEAQTSIERPVPQLLLAKTDGVRVADFDFHEEKLLYSKTTHPAAIAYLAEEKRVFWMEEEGAIMVSSLDGTNISLIKHLASEGTCLTVDWVGRQLYWAEVNKKESSSSVWSVDLSYNTSPKQIFNRSSIIKSLEVEPFSRSLIWTIVSGNSCSLMISDVSGSNIRPFFSSRALEYQTNKMKVKRMTGKNVSCNCNPSIMRVGQAMTVDSTNSSRPQILWVDGNFGHIWSSDINGCHCQLLINTTEINVNGLPPTSLTVDKSHIYVLYSNKTLGKLYSMSKENEISEYLTEKPIFMSHQRNPITAEAITGIRSIRAIGGHLQPFPSAECLISELYNETAELVSRTSYSLTLYLPEVQRPEICNKISSPTVLFTVYYGPSNIVLTHECFEESDKLLCSKISTDNNTVTIRDLHPFTNYSIRVSVRNYYTRGKSLFGPEVIYQTAEGVPSPPMAISAKPVTPFKIDVTWLPPLFPNGYPISYEIRWRVKDYSKTTLSAIHSGCGEPSGAELAMSISSEPGKDHYITVRAYSSNCDMYNDSEEVTVTSYILPSNLTCQNSTPSSLTLSWIAPNDSSVLYFSLEYLQDDGIEGYESSTSKTQGFSPQNVITITNLTPRTEYNFRLILIYSGKEEKLIWPQNSFFQCTTDGDRPSTPGIPQVKHIGRQGQLYQVFWQEAINNGYEDLIYELEMRCQIIWKSDSDGWELVHNNSNTQWIVDHVSGNINYQFRVKATNEYGSSNYSYSEKPFYLPETEAYIDPGDKTVNIVISSVVAIIIILSVVVAPLCIIYLKKEKCKKILQEVTPNNQLVSDLELATLQDLPMNGHFVHETNALYNLGDLPSDEELITLPHIQRDKIILTKFLGSGAFGEVFEGVVFDLNEDEPYLKIAVKTLKKGATQHEKEEFLKEAKLMSNFKHEHILQLLGVCIESNPNFIILELMEGGDLLSFLRSNRPTAFHSSNLTMDDLLSICTDVAKGCKYLESLHFVHRDLAARNCLVSSYEREDRIVKIGDFGLARDIYKNDYYRKEGEGLLPVRWMAPESLVYGVFTSQSDVWAFGVLLWEVMTLGQQPYPARSNMEVLHYVRDGGRLDKPENCPDDLKEIMLSCWSYDADDRPNFCYCLHALEELRRKLEPATLVMPSVYNFAYYSQGFDNLGYCENEMTEISHTSANNTNDSYKAETPGAYIGQNNTPNNDGTKLQDDNIDSRSTQSDPSAMTMLMAEANSVRRSLSWTNLMSETHNENLGSNERRGNNRSNRKHVVNKYLELLGDNEDSDGYQVPVKLANSSKKATHIPERKHVLGNIGAQSSSNAAKDLYNHQIINSSSLNAIGGLPNTSNYKNEFDVTSPEALNSRINSSQLTERFNLSPEYETATEEAEASGICTENVLQWMKDCDEWSTSTASLTTYHFDACRDNQRNSGISALSCVSGIDMNYTCKSSYC
ncbi:proto-oncogene tyrosine-protein kinase ROS-like, partial [Stegodyphus dumicola]|uniref:proto-oncogene tyrosine-protein kinase ROS-like n=1 Tax=Stegodyphus dumicola TaxID=202533 RepID=UPI0015B0BAEC